MNMQQANAAAVASKVTNQTAKKIAKEVIKDSVVDMSFNMVMNYKYVPKDERIKAKEGFELVCMPDKKLPDGECSAPTQMKKDIDRNSLDSSVEKSLDKKIAGGIGATKWGKFLDWVVPMFALGLGFAVVEGALNGDIMSLFDEISYDALSEMGYLQPVEQGDPQYEGLKIEVFDGVVVLSSLDFTYYYKDDYGEIWFHKGQSLTFRFSSDRITVYNPIRSMVSSNITYSGAGSMSDGARKSYASGFASGFYKKNNGENLPVKPIPGGTVPLPKFNETGLPLSQPNVPKKILAPGAFPMEETGTGITVYPYTKPDGTTGFKTAPDATTGISRDVQDDNVTVKDPVVIKNPDGTTTVKKAPTLENPNPHPSEDGVLPPAKDPNAPPVEFPEGESCSDSLKLPKILPLFHSLSTSFPFSIPWDLKSGFDAVFSEMGKEKPEFSYKFEFNGSQKEWKLSFPSYFDTWKPFTDSMLIFVFDVGLVYAIYRLMQGGGS